MSFRQLMAPSVFQELMSTVLQRQEQPALYYLDDILAFAFFIEHHLEHIQMAFNSLTKQFEIKTV